MAQNNMLELAASVNATLPIQNLLVYRAEAFCATEGVNRGDPITVMEELVPDDVYVLDAGARRHRLALHVHGDEGLEIAGGTDIGTPGGRLHLDCSLTLMSPEGRISDALVMVEVDDDQTIDQIYLLPLARLNPETGYRIVNLERATARRKFAQLACASFSRGTNITMASGEQVPIEKLRVGDRVLTRDEGPQAVRWIGLTTVRAEGEFAPIVITAGTLNNEHDLVVSPDHRLFVYQRTDELGAGRAELLVKARHLVNGESVYVQQGGHVDYFQLLFDRHHIIYAEGIAAESLLIEPRNRPALPPELLEKLSSMLPSHGRRDDHGLDVQKALLDRPDAIELLRRASLR